MKDIQIGGNKYSAAQQYLREQPERESNADDKSRKLVILGFLVSVTLIGFIVFVASFVFNGATITIKPVKKDLQVNETFVVSAEERQKVLSSGNVAATENIALPKNSLKKVSSRASGDITIYNNFDAKAQKLIKGTRFATTDGKIFRIQDSVTVPGKSGANAGTIKARVVADSEGETYNIGASRFNIPGFKGSPKFTGFYAESSKVMSGGNSGKASGVSDLDMEQGKNTLKENLKKTLNASMSKAAPEGYTFSPEASLIVYGTPQLIDSDNTTATYEMPATGTALYIKREALVQSIVEKTENLDTSSASVEILDSKDFVISVIDPADITDSDKPVRLIITGNAPVVFKPNKEKVIDFVLGKNRSEFADMTKKIQFIEGAKSVIRPFWANSFPGDRDKIDVVVE